jgi:hypothetical protein
MNDNQILECGGIEVQDNGITVKNFINIIAGTNDNDASPGGLMSKFIRTASSGTYTVDYQVAGDSTEFGDRTWQDARYVYNSADAVHNLRQVWGIVTSSNITPVGSTIGDIHFYNSVYVDGKVGIGITNPSTSLQVVIPPGGDGITGISAKSADVNTTIGAYSQGWFAPGDNVGSLQVTRGDNSTFYTLAVNPRGGDIYLGSSISNLIVFSESVGIGTTNPQTTLDVTGDIFASTGFITQDTRYLDSAQIIYGYNTNSTILQYYYDNINLFDTLEIAPAGGSRSQIKFNTATSGTPAQASTQMILSHDGRLGIGTTTPSYKLDVNGDIYATGNITAGSDLRFKTNISTLTNSLSTIKNMTGVSYNMIANSKNKARQIGLIAQEVERVLPEVVFTDNSPEQFKSVSYGNIVAILIEAVKELSDKVDNLEKLIHITK